MTELQQHLANSPSRKVVYFNQEGEWLFTPHPKFPIEKTRDEVLGSEEKKTETDITKSKKVK